MVIGGSAPRIRTLNLPHRCTGRKVQLGRGTLLRTGGTVRRYATIALRSSSFMVENDGQSIGNGRSRVPSRKVPLVMTRLISSSVQLPRPVSLSDVRFPVANTPYGAT